MYKFQAVEQILMAHFYTPFDVVRNGKILPMTNHHREDQLFYEHPSKAPGHFFSVCRVENPQVTERVCPPVECIRTRRAVGAPVCAGHPPWRRG